jgi:ribosomal RNA-processing protein 1
MDKYYMLLRIMIRSTFAYLRDKQWNEKELQQFEQLLSNLPLTASALVPRGIRTHVSDLYLDELEQCLADDKSAVKVC